MAFRSFMKSQREWRMSHSFPTQFYVSCWQRSSGTSLLLVVRSLLFLVSLSLLVASVVTVTLDFGFGYWFIYFGNWALLMMVLTMGFGSAVSASACYYKHMDSTFGLPWYVKAYWVLYNITIPVAFLITVFYWCLLKRSGKKVNYAPNPILDVMLHGVNSVVMFVELVMSAHPSRLIHIIQPLFFALAYLLFSLVYYAFGGQDPWGNDFIYPVVDWSKPDKTLVVVSLTALFLAVMHLATVAVAALRDFMARRCANDVAGVENKGFVVA